MTQKLFFALLAALLLAALFLAGCGGGGGDGGKNDTIATLEADVAMLQADVAAANAAKSTAERARQAAEAAQADAEAARAEAEAAKEAAEMARNEANAAAGAAEARATAAEEARQTAEIARDEAITARDNALMAQETAEGARDAALADKKTAEDALAAANNQATADLAALRQQLATANTNLQTAQDNLDDANDDLQDANDALTQARTDLATRTRERDTALQERNQAREALARAQGELEGLRASLTQAQQEAAEAERRRREAEAEAQRKIDEAEQQVDVSLRAGPLMGALDLGAADAAMATVRYQGNNLIARPNGLSTPGGTAPSVPGNWGNRASFSRARGAVGTDTAYLYTNIQRPGTKAFWKVYGAGVASADSDWDATLARRTGSLQAFDSNGDDADDATRFGGTYHGVSGTFTCTVGADTNSCNAVNATSPATGLNIIAGTWAFTPTRGNLTSGVRQDSDTEYLYFGIWEFVPKEPDPTGTDNDHSLEWIAGGAGTIDSTHFGPLTGEATFDGGAVGKYVIRNQAGPQSDRIGTFTAKAVFTADFDTNKLFGDITEFKEGGSSLGTNWSVYLGSSASEPADLGAAGTSGTPVTTASIDGLPAAGDWAATLHGSNNLGYNDFDDPGVGTTECPVTAGCPAADLAGVAGWFDAVGTNAAIAGAFGAACTKGPCGR